MDFIKDRYIKLENSEYANYPSVTVFHSIHFEKLTDQKKPDAMTRRNISHPPELSEPKSIRWTLISTPDPHHPVKEYKMKSQKLKHPQI